MSEVLVLQNGLTLVGRTARVLPDGHEEARVIAALLINTPRKIQES